MRKAGFLIVALMIAIPLFFAGCNKTKTYAEKLKAEKKAIERFMDKNDYYLIKKFPADSVFPDDKAFYRTTEGLYIHVIDKRYGAYGEFENDTIAAGSKVTVRFWKRQSFMIDTSAQDNWKEVLPVSFTRGSLDTRYAPQGWDIALNYVGNFGLVRMIIPSIIGTSTDNSNVTPVFYDSVWYKLSY